NTTEQLVDDLTSGAACQQGDHPSQERLRLYVIGVPVLDRGDELALKMLARLAAGQVQFDSGATGTLTSELLKNLENEEPDLVFISALGPGGVGQVRYICKRAWQNFPLLPV